MKDDKESFRGLTRRDFLYLSGVGMAGLALAGIPESGHGGEEKPKYGGRLRMAERYNSAGLDAHRNQEFVDMQNYCLMYSALTELGPVSQVEIYPMLAKSWEISRDGREYIFSLREGVKFHHGKELDSGDVKYSIERVMNPATKSPRAYAFRWVDSIQVIDKYHIKIRLKEPFAPFLTTLTVHTCAIIPAGWEPTGMKPAPGTGPFVFKSIMPNDSTEYTRFDQYWEVDEKTGDRLPYLDGVHLKKVVDDTVRLNALRAGDLDFITNPLPNIMAKAVLEKPIPGIFMDYELVGPNSICFNVTKPPFDNKKVRQAIAYATNKKQAADAYYWGIGETLNNQAVNSRSRFYIPVKDRELDLAKAKQLLVEAGYSKGFKTEFFQRPIGYDLSSCEAIMGQLRAIGIEATMKIVDSAPYFAGLRKGEYSVSVYSDSQKLDWDDAFYIRFHSGEIGTNNFSRYSNKEVDALLEKGRSTVNWKERVPIYKRVIEMIAEDLPQFYLFSQIVGIACSDRVKGYRKGFSARFAWRGGGVKYFWLGK